MFRGGPSKYTFKSSNAFNLNRAGSKMVLTDTNKSPLSVLTLSSFPNFSTPRIARFSQPESLTASDSISVLNCWTSSSFSIKIVSPRFFPRGDALKYRPQFFLVERRHITPVPFARSFPSEVEPQVLMQNRQN